MELAGLRDHFAVGAFAEDGRTRTRLASVAARRARKQQCIPKNARISLIGDHANDVLAAKANQFQAVAVATGVMPFKELAALEPDILVHHLGEIDASKLL
jgi:phosphoglycolate phosphatase-like HAD superfamily hydrolase